MSSIRLFILDAFARHGEMHGHQLRLQAEEERVQLWTDFTVGSLYGAIKRLVTEGLLEEVRVEREGSFPERQVLAITGAGLEALRRLRHEQLTELFFKPDPFDLVLTRLDPERLDEVPDILAGRMRTIESLLQETLQHNAAALPYLSLSEKHALNHREHRLRSEIDWLRQLTAALPELIVDERARMTDPDHPAHLTSTAGHRPEHPARHMGPAPTATQPAAPSARKVQPA